MGIVKISDELHDEIRKSSQVMTRSINSQAEFWIKIGMLSEFNPTLTFNEIIQDQLKKESVTVEVVNE
ncbi:ParD-like family protein [Pseudoalteromonas denitrificans]|uniref:ParD-like antitoxin of type II toxin-antitoxin system n=1 Tax=Pseudoalteromonas denitrificans DSM 6059 TaxID=1123010 RepID=A0A1I1N572_9GAMM|nr:ParD-like family protein [Pseudoalteromonas denitrificans]SFC92769.1 ParD-like antitoxin of type II toxin-antitoxin system [Pseudoalteromonas denitrificans DSM 6059]